MSASSPSLNGFVGGAGSGKAKDSNVLIGHLDYNYISKCDNAKELEEIIKVLRSGSEGYYPDLVEYTETRLKEIDPKSPALRKDTPAQRFSDLDKASRKAVSDDLQDWMSKVNNVDSKLRNADEMVNGDSLPPVRSQMKGTKIETDKVTQEDTSKNKRTFKPREFKEWDKFDIDKELAEIDKKETSNEIEVPKTKKAFNAKLVTTKDLKPEESQLRALREKEKGNEAYRAMDYEEAIVYYTRSLNYELSAASYNNRAAAELKVEKYAEAIEDCKKVLKLEPNNIKAFLRRGMAYKALKYYDEATKDFQVMLSLDANNKRAKQLLSEIEEINRPPVQVNKSETCTPLEKSKGSGNKPSQKMNDERKIDENHSTEASASDVAQPTRKGTEEERPENTKSNKKGQRLKIIDIDSATAQETGNETLQATNQETGNETLENSKSKKIGQRLKIEEVNIVVDSGSDVLHLAPEGTGENSKGNTGPDLEEKEVEDPVKPGASKDHGGAPAKDTGISIKNTAEGTKAGPSTDVVKENDLVATTTHVTFAKPVEEPVKEEAKVVVKIPSKVKSFMEQGNKLYKTGHYAQALEKFSKCVDSLWKDREAYSSAVSSLLNNKAACYLKMGDCKQCVEECDKSLGFISNNRVLIRRGIAYETMEKYAEAFRDFNRVRLLDGSNKLAQEHCSRVIKHLEMLHGKSWRKEIFEMKNSDEGKTQAFPNPDKNKKTCDAIHVCGSKESEKTSSLPPTPPQIDLQREAGPKTSPTKPAPDYEVKVDHNVEFEKKKQEQYLKLKDSGNSLVKQGKHQEAINHYTDCIKLCPEVLVGYTNRALCFLQLNKHELAEADCNAALDIQADNIKALFRRAKARRAMKRYRDSSQDLIAVLKLDAKNSHAKTELHEVLKYLRKEKDTEKSTVSKRKKIIINDIEDDKDKASNATVTGDKNISESERNKQSKVAEETLAQQSSSEKIANGQNSVPVKEVSSPVAKDKKSLLSERNKDSKDVKEESIQDSSDENIGDTGKVSVAKDTMVSASELDEPKVVKKEHLQPPCSDDIGKEQNTVHVKHNVKTAFQFLQSWKEIKNGDTSGFLSILKQVNLSDLPKIISNRLDADMIRTMFQALHLELKSKGDVRFTYDFLQMLHCVERFEMTLMFQSKEEKRALSNLLDNLIDHSKQQTQINSEDLAKLRKRYCV